MNRLLQCLALEIPQRDVHSRDCLGQCALWPQLVRAQEHALPDHLGVERISADHERLERVDEHGLNDRTIHW